MFHQKTWNRKKIENYTKQSEILIKKMPKSFLLQTYVVKGNSLLQWPTKKIPQTNVLVSSLMQLKYTH